jgi:NitT/TauT family transport system permease protein
VLRQLWTAAGVLFLIGLWKCGSLAVGEALLVPAPEAVLAKLAQLAVTPRFLSSLLGTFLRLMAALAVSIPLGLAAGLAAGLSPSAERFLRPFFAVISATPVMSIILIAYLWFGAEKTPSFAAFLMIFPVVTANTLSGVRAIDPKLEELFAVYRMNFWEKARFLYFPSLTPFIAAGCRAALGLCWKVVVAAEVLVQPLLALGTGMQRAKAALDTTGLFAWTAAAVLASALSEWIFRFTPLGKDAGRHGAGQILRGRR